MIDQHDKNFSGKPKLNDATSEYKKLKKVLNLVADLLPEEREARVWFTWLIRKGRSSVKWRSS